jgi:ribosome-associated translation inhibitor RaiA
VLLTKEIRSYVERRLRFTSDHFADQLGDVTVVLRDLNGHSGGVDKECVIRVNSPRVGRLTVEQRSEGVMGAIFGAVQRFSDTAMRRIGRQRDHRSSHVRRLQSLTHEP